jgi:hypothetical protein
MGVDVVSTSIRVWGQSRKNYSIRCARNGCFDPPVSRGEFFNRSTSILIAAARIALEPPKRISRVQSSGRQIKTVLASFFLAHTIDAKFLDNSRQNFFAHVRDGSHCKKIAIVAIRIMPA